MVPVLESALNQMFHLQPAYFWLNYSPYKLRLCNNNLKLYLKRFQSCSSAKTDIKCLKYVLHYLWFFVGTMHQVEPTLMLYYLINLCVKKAIIMTTEVFARDDFMINFIQCQKSMLYGVLLNSWLMQGGFLLFQTSVKASLSNIFCALLFNFLIITHIYSKAMWMESKTEDYAT